MTDTRVTRLPQEHDPIETWAFWTLTASLALVQLSVAAAETLFGISALLWLVLVIRDRRVPNVPPFFVPLLMLAGWTLVSTALSPEPRFGLHEDKQLLLYLVVPIAMRVVGARGAPRVLTALIAVGGVSALAGIVQGIVVGDLSYDYLIHNRPHGLLGHYMTYSGVLMLVLCAAAAQLIFAEREWLWPAVAVPAMLVALAVTLSRNVWLGALAAIVALLVVRRPRLLIAVPVVLAIALAVAPVRSRALDVFDPSNATNRDRVSMIKSGGAMIRDHALFGVGPNRVPEEYLAHYKRADAVDPADQPGSTRAHLHNVVVQLAAERGLPALAAWLWFVAVAAIGLLDQMRRGPAPALAAAGFAAVIAMLIAGLFEHNFGDSEFLFLFLGLITLPYAARYQVGAPGSHARVEAAA
ncbi:MAG TPA: O-antigen ligase family protein [Vicinamibacterales bacterium]|nr:O-antigen ligase family protein [Vicinamibacterales bacterium]